MNKKGPKSHVIGDKYGVLFMVREYPDVAVLITKVDFRAELSVGNFVDNACLIKNIWRTQVGTCISSYKVMKEPCFISPFDIRNHDNSRCRGIQESRNSAGFLSFLRSCRTNFCLGLIRQGMIWRCLTPAPPFFLESIHTPFGA